jgi:hypothetical protein
MSEFQYKAGLNNVNNYIISGIPFVSGSITAPISSGTPVAIEFPSVTQHITVTNLCPLASPVAIRVGFSANGVKGTNYVCVPANDSLTLDVRTTKIFLLSNGVALANSASVCAALTGIKGYDLATVYSGSDGIG